ncbi:MAG: MBL fold metallo-hydrolase [Anaerolineae bacterium]
MKLTFLGTRGYIDPRTERHGMHSSMAVSYYDTRLVIDCGEDWLGQVSSWKADAIVVTHAHPDHAWGLKEGAPCPVYATADAWQTMDDFDIEAREVVEVRRPFEIGGIRLEAFGVAHSTRAPAVGYRLTAGRVEVFYVPDVVWIREREEALSGCRLYVGDGATMARSMVRKIDEALIGHTPVRTQLTWCQKMGVPRAIITHCGAGIVAGDRTKIEARLQKMANERSVQAEIAYDGLEVVLR